MDCVVVTGVGVVSPLGNSVAEVTARFARGERAPGMSESLEVSETPLPMPPDLQARSGRMDRLSRFFLSAAYQALVDADVTVPSEQADRFGLSFGTGLGCLLTDAEYNRKIVEHGPAAASPRLFASTVSSAAAGEVSIALGLKGPNVTAHMGFAAGLGAVGYGFDLIQMGKADVVLAGGADVIGPALVEGLRDMGLLKPAEDTHPFRDAAPGVYPSEAAVVVVLEGQAHARRRRARCLARIQGYAAGFEPTLTRRVPRIDGLTATLKRALAFSDHHPGAVGAIFSSAHGTPLDAVERSALVEVFGPDSDALVLAPKWFHGECFAGSGVLAMALASEMWRERPNLVDGLGYEIGGDTVGGVVATARLRAASVVLINALCYSGNVVSLALAREG